MLSFVLARRTVSPRRTIRTIRAIRDSYLVQRDGPLFDERIASGPVGPTTTNP
jgi:hypothetical protein